MNLTRKTKIVATIGPASESPELLRRLIEEGMDAARLNFSHGNYAEHRNRIRTIRALEKQIGKPIAIIGDLQGPKIRIGILPEEGVVLENGKKVVFNASAEKYQNGIIPLPSKIFADGTKKGNYVFLNDGALLLKVTAVRGTLFTLKVLHGGILTSHKGVNVPMLTLRSALFGKKDKADIDFAIREGVDYVALSFLRNAKDIYAARKLLKHSSLKVIAKIERPEALAHLEEIIDAADAVMVARGDLGIETPLWGLPVRQKEIIEAARRRMKPVIVATQMLQSMTENAIPTRAEVSDVANAVYDSADAVMLSGESASGAYPAESVRMMRKILEETEKHASPSALEPYYPDMSVSVSVAKSVKYIASEVGARAILAGTKSGFSALAASHFRPTTPIVAVVSEQRTARLLALGWGITPVFVHKARSIDNLFKIAMGHLKKKKLLSSGDKVVFLSGLQLGKIGQTNTISVSSVK